MGTQIGIVHLGSRISKGTGLELGHDYVLSPMKNKRKSTENPLKNRVHNPREWAYIRFLEWKDKNKLSAVKNLLFDFLKKEKIGYKKDSKTYFVRIKDEHEITPTEDASFQKKEIVKDSPEKILAEYARLKELHKKLPIYGVANIDQPDLLAGIAYFNYFDEEQTQLALKIFSDAGFGVEERIERKCNLTFVLLTEGIDETKLVFGKGKPNGRIVKIFEWVIKKIYRKKLGLFSENTMLDISGRGKIYCGEPEIFQIKKELEENFGITILIHSSSKNTSEIFLLLSDKAREIYHKNKQIGACDLIKILKNPETESYIKNLKSNAMEKEKTLSIRVAEILRSSGFVLSQNRKENEICLELRHKDENFIKISALGGTLEEKQALIKKVKECFLKLKEVMFTDNGKTETKMTVSMPGLKNISRQKRRAVKPTVNKTAEKVSFPENIVQNTTGKESMPSDLTEKEETLWKMIHDPLIAELMSYKVLKRATNYFQRKKIDQMVNILLAELNTE